MIYSFYIKNTIFFKESALICYIMRTILRAPSHIKRTLVTVNPVSHINFVHAQ